MKKLIVLFASVALVLSFAITASAADWNFYGSARMTTFWNDNDAANGDDDGLTWAQQGNSRIGASAKGDAVSGRFEFSNAVGTRLLYGTWNFGGGTLLVGQTYSPYNIFISNQVYGGDSDMLNFNAAYGGRQQMLQVSFGSFKIALVRPTAAAIGGGDVDVSVPKVEASYSFKSDLFWATVAGLYQTWEEVGTAAGSIDVDSYALQFGAGFNFGPAGIKFGGAYGQNLGNTSIWLAEKADAAATITGATLNDADTVAFGGVVTFKATDMLSLEGGIAYIDSERDNTAGSDDGMTYYVQAVISPAPGVYIIPEIGIQDFADNRAGTDEGSTTYFGAKWQINW